MRAATSWRIDVSKTVVVESKEIITQVARMASVFAVRYAAEHIVPPSSPGFQNISFNACASTLDLAQSLLVLFF